MAELDKSVQAHVSVFMFLGINGQSIRPFVTTGEQPGMGPQKMRDLTFFNGAGSLEMLKAVAAQMAHMLILHVNTYYTQQREAGHGDGRAVGLDGGAWLGWRALGQAAGEVECAPAAFVFQRGDL